ncbi:hypothetical protein LEP1GSC195_1435 [Leptospira wolbachii serovar Codice str. CDC]|uniref:Uncharacterized protein n=1 Tax=Leptospira wolbachii serovar Codice str. CDC TaxID=1218599 RepID=R8ZYM6_9LEPT|nr:hypothetical protein LEP1GSC195_1435 [Leptospira wolbachii serovar Codice str. CDC]
MTLFSCNFLLKGPEQEVTYDEFYIHKTFSTGNIFFESNNISFSIPKNQLTHPTLLKIKYTENDQILAKSIDLQINNQYFKNLSFRQKKQNLIREVYVSSIDIETSLISNKYFPKIENIVFYIKNDKIQKIILVNKEDLEVLNQLMKNTSH